MSCNIDKLEAKIAKIKRTHHPEVGMRELFDHHIKEARALADRGHCSRAMAELKHAKKVARF